MAEEEVMRKRLAVEGDGGGDDRRVMSLLKTFVRWCNSKGLSDEESEATYQKMLFTLGEPMSKYVQPNTWFISMIQH